MVTAVVRGNLAKQKLAMVEMSDYFMNKHNVLIARALVDPSDGKVPVRCMNVTDEPKTIYKGSTIGECVPVEPVDGLAYNISVDDSARTHPQSNSRKSNPDEGEVPQHLTNLYNRSCQFLKEEDRKTVAQLLQRFQNVFSRSPTDIGRSTLVKHKIDTGTARPIKQADRRLPLHQRGEERKEIDRMLDQGIISHSSSPWASPIVLVKKKDGTTRFCVDYRKLNEVTVKDSYPLPRIDDSLDALSGAEWFSTLDLQSGYWQVEMDPQDRNKTAFTTASGLYQLEVLPFRLCNAPATFERLIEQVLRGLHWQTCLLYLDDVIVYGRTLAEEIQRLKEYLLD